MRKIILATMEEEQVIQGLKLKYLKEKENNYGSNHFFEILDVEPLAELMKLKDEDMMLPFWEYNERFYLKINDHKIGEFQRKKLKENVLYITDLTFKPYDFQKDDKRLVGI